MDSKKISIITPFHNEDLEVFKKTIDSVTLAKEYLFEWIIVIHNTIESDINKLKCIIPQDLPIYLYEINDNTNTPSVPRNYGLARAKGEFIYFLDSDDVFNYDFFSKALDKFKDNTIDIVIAKVEQKTFGDNVVSIPMPLLFPYNENGYIVSNSPKERGNLLYGSPMMIGSKIIRHSIIEKNNIVFDEKIMLTEDSLFFLECCLKADKICIIFDTTSYSYVQRENSLLQKLIKNIEFNEDTYLLPIEKVVSLCLKNNISPSSYLWRMFGLISTICKNKDVSSEKRKNLLSGMQRYIIYMEKIPPSK